MVKGVMTRKRKNTEDAELKKSTKTETSNKSRERKLRKNVKESEKKQLNSLVTEEVDSEEEFETDSNRNHVFRNNANKLSDRNLDKRLSPTCSIDDCSSQKLDSFQRDLLSKGLYPRENVPQIKAFNTWAERSSNLVHYFQQMTLGNRCRLKLQKSVTKPVVDLISDLQIHRTASPFDRRVTVLEWHPTKLNILGVGSKGGDIILWDTNKVGHDKFVHGSGAGGSCQAMKFWPWDTDRVVSASLDGTVTLHDFEGRQNQILADTMNSYDHWFCSVDVSPRRYLVAAGRNHGLVRLMSTEGREVFEFRLHKNKVTHVEFSPREDWLLCTASTDNTVQLWDVRMLKDRKSSLAVLKHERPVNSAYFSGTDGCQLLTTDQHNELRVYQSPSWHLDRVILHPHRFFQHITPFKLPEFPEYAKMQFHLMTLLDILGKKAWATWHPLQDLIVVGRYPDKNFPGYQDRELRTIDVIDPGSGETVHQIHDPAADGLTCLNKFNRQGDALASGMGFHILLWNRKELLEAKQSSLKNGLTDFMSGSLPKSGSRSNTRSRPRTQGKEKKKSDTKTKTTKTKSATETNLKKVRLKTKTEKK